MIRRCRTPLVLVLLLALLPLHVLPAAAVPSEDDLAEAEQRRAELDDEVADAEAELAAVTEKLDELEAQLAEAEAELERVTEIYTAADRAATEASDRARAAEAELADARAELETNRQQLSDLARDTFKYGAPASDPALAVFSSLGEASDDDRFADRLHYLQRGIGVRSAALESSEALSTEVDHLTRRAQQEEAAREQALTEAEEARDVAAEAHEKVNQLTTETSAQLARSEQLVAQLEDEQEQVQAQVVELRERVAQEKAEQERRERERRERERREREERERREREERERAAAASSRSGSSGGSGGSSGSGGGVTVAPGPRGGLRSVQGIVVAASLAPQLEALLNAARADGIVLGGHGWRSPEVTARLRRANGCPDVYRSPASSCRVPTARPGTSQHERGLAVDFTYQGRTICYPNPGSRCSGNAAYSWLRANAGRFGLRNLPSEAWHWSTTGR